LVRERHRDGQHDEAERPGDDHPPEPPVLLATGLRLVAVDVDLDVVAARADGAAERLEIRRVVRQPHDGLTRREVHRRVDARLLVERLLDACRARAARHPEHVQPELGDLVLQGRLDHQTLPHFPAKRATAASSSSTF
jgi:hypothetical protein